MTWMISANTDRFVDGDRSTLAKKIAAALAKTKLPRALTEAMDLVRSKRIELFSMEQMQALGACLYEAGVSYKIFRLVREDIDMVRRRHPGIASAVGA